MSKTGNTAAALVGQKNEVNRWSLELGNVAAETGSDSGSDLLVNCYSDAGALIDSPLSVDRSNGAVATKSLLAKGTVTTQPSGANVHLAMSGKVANGADWFTPMVSVNPGFSITCRHTLRQGSGPGSG